ncbi:hypothetical protein CLV80_108120 [Yoonia maritima]|uniref:Acyl-CoA dehydrogenase-like protein n=1 Tax=Yoonia maritima TaxID=1435347 RepID=A0A2T0VXH4_9RHOB|nr:hypothetical protein [Yoonia maritima]PRY76656.1 hypothetical protein CLV80_108120 [Yoonia maritima]
MLDTARFGLGEQVFSCAREAAPDDALRVACEAVSGISGNLVCGPFVVHRPGDILVNAAAPGASVEILEDLQDAGLAPFGLTLSRVHFPGGQTLPPHVGTGAIALRLGLLAQMLDRAFVHLEKRDSFGQKLLHQPLVKGQFSASGTLLTRIRAEMAVDAADPLDVETLHDEISRHTIQVGKLMGGHGFRTGSLNDLEYLSGLLCASMTPRPAGEA